MGLTYDELADVADRFIQNRGESSVTAECPKSANPVPPLKGNSVETLFS